MRITVSIKTNLYAALYVHFAVAFPLASVHMGIFPVSLIAQASGLLPPLGLLWMLPLGPCANGRLAFPNMPCLCVEDNNPEDYNLEGYNLVHYSPGRYKLRDYHVEDYDLVRL